MGRAVRSPAAGLLALLLGTAACSGIPAHGREPPSPPSLRAPPGATTPQRYTPPVSAPVVDGFRPPPGGFGAGNRGLEYDTEPGDPVGAIGAGTVVFAGPVAGTLHVTVLHPDGIRSSYSYLESVAVEVHEPVGRARTVGTASDRLHLGIRAGTAYLDPARLFAPAPVHLVPVPP